MALLADGFLVGCQKQLWPGWLYFFSLKSLYLSSQHIYAARGERYKPGESQASEKEVG